MVRSLLSIGSLIAIIGWLVLSYLPASVFSPPVFGIGGELSSNVILSVLVLVFIFTSGLVVRSTWRSLVPVVLSDENRARCWLSTEIFWAVVPLVITLVVVLLSYYAWTLQ